MIHHRPILFPLVVCALTVILAVGIAWIAPQNRSNRSSSAPSSTVQGVSEEDYQSAAKSVLAPFRKKYDGADNDIARLVLVEDALRDWLDIRVPSGEKDFHLETAFALNAMRDGLRGSGDGLEQALKRLDAAMASRTWMK